ncbi:MAG: VWA domain-containing protein, partial [Spirochaetota bacterium]|nr:VWA domain-containing protein [Spirochaetota bacterium]
MIQKYLNYFFILILSSFIILKCNPSDPISNSANTNDKNLSSKEKFEKLATEKKNEKTDLEYIKKHGIIKTDVQATNPITQVAVRDFKVSISQIDNSKFPEVTLLVSVTDTDGNPLVVNKDFFNIEENGFKIPKSNIISIVQKKDVDKKSVSRPLNILLAIDKSGSMQGNAKDIGNQPLTFAKDAAIEFIRQAQKNDTVQVIAFDGDIHRLGTNEFAVRRIKSLQPKGSTALYGVLLSSVKELQMGGGIKSVILLTDGRNDTRGTINLELKSVTLEMGLHAADQLAIPVFTIGFGSKADDETLKEIARRTHALYFKTAKKEEILLLYKQIREIINTQYLITYRSESLQEVTDVKVELGRFVDRRTFTTPSFVVNREKKVREDIAIINQEKNRLEQFEKDLNDKAANLKKSQVIFDEEKIALKEQENKLNSEMTKIKLRESELNSFETRVKELESKIKEEKMRLDKVKQSLDSKEASLN